MENQAKALILVVDDDRDIAEVIRIYLAAADYRILIAKDGVEALELLTEHSDVSLVLMDIMMPRMDGIAATLRIREERNLPILMLTAKSEETDLVEGLNAGADDYITLDTAFHVLTVDGDIFSVSLKFSVQNSPES